MKLFLDDFTIFNDLDIHLSKVWKCFEKCQEYKVSLKLKNCAFMVLLGMILRFIVSKKGKLLDPKKIKTIVKMLIPKELSQHTNLQQLSPILLTFCENFAFIMAPNHKTNAEVIRGDHLHSRMPRHMGDHQVEICEGSNFDCLELR
jgi:hypothetical protein